MSIGLLLVTHPGIGEALLTSACTTLSGCPLRTRCVEVPPDADPEQLMQQVRNAVTAIDDGSGVLVLTDAYGATPSNLACRLCQDQHVSVVSGVNLPMLIRIFNYANDNLEALASKAAEGGLRGIQISCRKGD